MPRFNGFRVLVVDDEFLIAMDVSDLLVGLGCEVIGPVARLDDAARIAHEETIDGAILDVNVAGQKIDPVVRMLCEKGVPVILVTGYGAEGIAADLQSVPRLMKPFADHNFEALALQVFAPR